jgi:hypothetical protein
MTFKPITRLVLLYINLATYLTLQSYIFFDQQQLLEENITVLYFCFRFLLAGMKKNILFCFETKVSKLNLIEKLNFLSKNY